MDFKKLNENLGKYIINELSPELKQRVLDKRQQQLQDLEQEKQQDSAQKAKLKAQASKFAQELINRTVLCKIDGKEVKLVFHNDYSGPLYVRLSENNIFKDMLYRLINFDEEKRVYDTHPSKKFSEEALRTSLTRPCFEYNRALNDSPTYRTNGESLSMLDCISLDIIEAITDKKISSFEIIYKPLESTFYKHLCELFDSTLSKMEGSILKIQTLLSVCPEVKNRLDNKSKGLLSTFTNITEDLQINEISTDTIYNAHKKALDAYNKLNNKENTYGQRKEKLLNKIELIKNSMIGSEQKAKMEKKKQTIFNTLQKIAMKAFKDYGYKVHKEDYDAEENYPYLLEADAVDDTLVMYIDKKDLDKLNEPEFLKEVAKKGFECDATIRTGSMGFEDSYVTLNTKDISTSIENIQLSIDNLIEEAHVDEEDQDEWDDVDLSPRK